MIKSAIVQNARFGVFLLLVAMVLGALVLFHEVILPFVLAAFLSYLIHPIVAWLHGLRVRGRRVPRGAAILAVYAVVIGLMIVGGAWFLPRFTGEVNRLVRTLPTILHQVEQNWVLPLEERVNNLVSSISPSPEEPQVVAVAPQPAHNGVARPAPEGPRVDAPWRALLEEYTYVVRRVDEDRFEVVPRRRSEAQAPKPENGVHWNLQVSELFAQSRSLLEENLIDLLLKGRRFLLVVANSFFSTFLVLMLAAFILIDPGRILRFLRSLFPRHYQGFYRILVKRLDHGLSGVVRGQLIICAVNGVLTGIGITLLGVPFAFTLSLLATVFSLIPIFGVLISTVPILVIALTQSLTTALLALAWILVIHFIEGNFLNPKILGDAARIHPALIVFALVVGQYMAGVAGALLAVPIFSLLQTSFLFLKTMAENAETA